MVVVEGSKHLFSGNCDTLSYLTPLGEQGIKSMAESDGKTVGNAVQSIFELHGNDVDVSTLRDVCRNIVLVNYAHYRIGNGGFNAFLSSELTGDPTYALTSRAHSVVGADAGADAISKALAVFPDSVPPSSATERTKIYGERYSIIEDIVAKRETPDTLYFASLDATMNALAVYVRQNAEELP